MRTAFSLHDIRATAVFVPPLDDEFLTYTDETTERARKWALAHHFVQVTRVPKCAHGLYLLPSCPGRCAEFGLDHTTIWVPYEEPNRPFILTQPYVSEITKDLQSYADAHGLHVASNDWDAWYGFGTMPIRLMWDANMLCPLEEEAVLAFTIFPTEW